MQAASGSRGALAYSGDELDADFLQTNNITSNATANVLPILNDAGNRDTGIFVTYAGFTLRDQVRGANASTVTPLQFSYLAADCRSMSLSLSLSIRVRAWELAIYPKMSRSRKIILTPGAESSIVS